MVLNTYEENKGVIFRSLRGIIKIKWCLSDLVSFMDMKCKTTLGLGQIADRSFSKEFDKLYCGGFKVKVGACLGDSFSEQTQMALSHIMAPIWMAVSGIMRLSPILKWLTHVECFPHDKH